jgi:hypothetical protein
MSWEQLLGVYREARELRLEEEMRVPVACRYDGTPLEDTDRGLHCKYCGWVWSGSTIDK